MTQEWNVSRATHNIRVVRTDSGGACLDADDDLLDVTNDWYASGDEATLAGVFGDDEMFRVEAFLNMTAEPLIRVNGEWIGDRAEAIAS